MPKGLCSTREAANRIGVTPASVRNWVRRGLINGFQDSVSRMIYVCAEDVEKMSPKRRLRPIGRKAEDAALCTSEER